MASTVWMTSTNGGLARRSLGFNPTKTEMSVSRSVDFAASLLREIYPLDRRLVAVIRDEEVAHLIGALTDEVLRIRDARSAAARFRRAVAGETYAQMGNEALSRVRKRPDQTLSRVRKRPDQTLPLVDRVLHRVGAVGSWIAPVTVMRMVKARLRSASSGQVIPLAGAVLAKRLGKTHAEGSRTNVNLLGEAIIGEDEAIARRDGIVALLCRPDVDAVSVKLSSVGANISALAFDATVERLKDRLRPVYRAARDRSVPALVTLDMEEYRDLELTASVFIGLLSEVEFSHYTGGIVLQAYLPDAHGVAERLANFGRSRVANGGAPIRVRLVKGANLAMERVEAELRGWPLATYSTKTEVDVSFKRLLGFLLGPSHDRALIVGLASHNLFDIAWGFEHRRVLLERGVGMRLEFETLEGMAEGLARAIARHGASSLVYSPVVDTRSFESAIAYLVRRLDENTTPENFLNALADLHVDSDRFRSEAAKFSEAVCLIDGLDVSSKRAAVHPTHAQRTWSHGSANAFENEADTDFSVLSLREPILHAVESWCPAAGHIEFADHRQVDECIGTARSALETWSVVGHGSRKALLNQLGAVISKRRAEIIAVMVHETSKTVAQADPEVSEAVDFARYYACSTNLLHDLEADGLESRPYGVVVVAPPWNFPFAILVGGVCAALAAGNVVVIKPAPEARSCAQMVAKCCWNAGFSKEVVQFLPCEDNENGQHLISHPDVNVVLLTGAIETARMFLRWRPKLTVMGETSGKNAIVVTASADIELALKDLVSSAFGHAGQKCSAASLAILAPCWYDDPEILIRLADAVRSLRCGPASDPSTDVPPLIGAPSDRLRRALTVLGDEERWLVEPRQLGDDVRQ